jgi:hypothetical protein
VRVIPFSPEAQSVLRRCREVHVVLDFVRLGTDQTDQWELRHQRAAIVAVAEACRQRLEDIDDDVAEHWRNEAQRVEQIDPRALRGRRIAASEFFGSGYAGGALVQDVDEHYSVLGESLDFTRGFCVPPYGLHIHEHCSQNDLVELFRSVIRKVLSSPDETSEIWAWSTDWSEYFEAGREWWGTACWTLDVGDGSIVAVLASTTD